jgi:hypothetical protein
MGILRTDKISGLETPTAVTGSVYFDGVSNDSLQIANNTDFNFPGDFTIECWTYSITALDSYNVEFAHIAGKGNGIAASTYALGFYQSKINFTTSNSGGTYTVRQGASTLTNNTWYHFASPVKLYPVTVLSPKSVALPVDEMVTKSMIFDADGKVPAHNPRILDAQEPDNFMVLFKSPKSTASPVDAIFT